VRVAPGTTVVEAAYPDGSRPAPNAAQWFVLRDRLALDGHDVTDPRTGADPTGRPVVTLRFTPAGGQRWRETTRRLAQRGIALTIPGAAPQDDFQHFAVVLDDRLLTVPFVDDRLSPDGLDPRAGLQLEGEFTARGARALAALLRTGVLPVQLAPAKPGTP